MLRHIAMFALLFAVAPLAYADASPEFYQLLGEINAELKTFQTNRPPVCTNDLVDQAQNALQGEMFTSALNAVVVKPLETGAKAGLSMLGVPAAAITTYSMMRCAMDESDSAGFLKCALGEAIGYRAGATLDDLGADAVSGALAGVALDDAYGRVRGAYDAYQSTSEVVEGESSGRCHVKYRFSWSKRRSPGARGGRITFQAWVSDCDCRSANQVKSGYVKALFSVRYAKAAGNSPGWKLAPYEGLNIEAQCCGQSAAAKNRVFLFNPSGQYRPDTLTAPPPRPTTGSASPPSTGVSASGSPSTPTPPPTVQPPRPVELPAPERKEYSRGNPCPPCQPIYTKISAVVAESAQLQRDRSAALREKNEKIAEQTEIKDQIERLNARLAGEKGVGGSAYDPSTGMTTSAYDTGDGRVRITVTDEAGEVISEEFRDRTSTADIEARRDAKIAERDQLQTDIDALQKRIEEIDQQRAKLDRKYENLQNALTECVKSLCNRYATCEQLLKHIESYENAGLASRSASIVNRLKKRAREMGCYNIDAEMNALVTDQFDLSGETALRTIGTSLDQEQKNRNTSELAKQRGDPLVCGRDTCAIVKIRDTINIRGNNPYDRRDPIAPDASRIGLDESSTSPIPVIRSTPPTGRPSSSSAPPSSPPPSTPPPPAPVEMVTVVGPYRIPISRLFLAGPDACPADHHHGDANDCNGVFRIDPAPGVCGHGTTADEMQIPVTDCPNL